MKNLLVISSMDKGADAALMVKSRNWPMGSGDQNSIEMGHEAEALHKFLKNTLPSGTYAKLYQRLREEAKTTEWMR